MTTAALEAIARRQLLERIYNKMSDDEKRLFVQLTMQNKSHSEIMAVLQQQQAQLADIKRHQQTFAADFASNVAGNAAYDAALWLVKKAISINRHSP